MVLAASIGASKTKLGVCDLAGAALAETGLDVDTTLGPEVVLRTVAERLDRLREKADQPVRGVGVCVPGPVDVATGTVLESPLLPGWGGVPITLGVTGVPVLVDNDVNALTLAEAAVRPGVTDLVHVKVSTGIGAGIIAGGVLQRGARGAAGEIGHNPVADGGGVVCRCGNLDCLEAVASGAALVAALRAAGREVADVPGVVALVRAGDPEAVALVPARREAHRRGARGRGEPVEPAGGGVRRRPGRGVRAAAGRGARAGLPARRRAGHPRARHRAERARAGRGRRGLCGDGVGRGALAAGGRRGAGDDLRLAAAFLPTTDELWAGGRSPFVTARHSAQMETTDDHVRHRHHRRRPPRRTRSRAANVALWTLQVLLAAVYAFSAFGKLTAEAQNVAGFQAMGLGNTGMYIIGSLELAGAIAMFIPRLTGLAATCFVALMIGAVTTTLAIGGGVLAVIPATVLVLAAVVAWGRRDSTRRLIHDVTGR